MNNRPDKESSPFGRCGKCNGFVWSDNCLRVAPSDGSVRIKLYHRECKPKDLISVNFIERRDLSKSPLTSAEKADLLL